MQEIRHIPGYPTNFYGKCYLCKNNLAIFIRRKEDPVLYICINNKCFHMFTGEEMEKLKNSKTSLDKFYKPKGYHT